MANSNKLISANNMAQLNRLLRDHAVKAMRVISKKSEEILYEETAGFYADTEPDVYIRTGHLGDTPRITPIEIGLEDSRTTVGFKALLDTDYTYDTGSEPTMEDVLHLANPSFDSSYVFSVNDGNLRPVVGNEDFWVRANKRIQEMAESEMAKFFK